MIKDGMSGAEMLRDIEQGFLKLRELYPDVDRRVILAVGSGVPESYVELLKQEYPFATVTRCAPLGSDRPKAIFNMIVDEMQAYECKKLSEGVFKELQEQESKIPYWRRFERKQRSR